MSEEAEEAIEMLNDLKARLFDDYRVYMGYTVGDFNKIIKILEG